MKVMEVLGGGRYRCFYAGAHYEVFAPSVASLSVGDLVMARVVRKAGQLFVPKVAASALFLAPGQYSQSGTGHLGQGTIYKLVGTTWQLLAHFGRDKEADPVGESDEAYVTCMFWDNTMKKLYATPWYAGWVYDTLTPNPQPYDLYQVNTATGVVTALGHSAVMRPVDSNPGYWNNPYCFCQQAAKLGNYWYIVGMRQEEYGAWPGSYYVRAVLYKFDPVANTMTVADSGPQDHDSHSCDNVGVATDGTTLYWQFDDWDSANTFVYRRTTDGINFITDEEHADLTRAPFSQMKYNPANGQFEVAGFDGGGAPRWAELLYRSAAPSWVVDEQVSGVVNHPFYVNSIGFRYVGSVPQREYVLCVWNVGSTPTVYSRPAASTGAFTAESVGGGEGSAIKNAFASLLGRIYYHYSGFGIYYRDDDVGIWTAGQAFTESPGYGDYAPAAHGFCLASSIPMSET